MIDKATHGIVRAKSVTPSNTVDLGETTRAIYVGVAGDISCEMVGGGTQVFVGLAAGMFHPIQCNRVNATGTTAASIVAGF